MTSSYSPDITIVGTTTIRRRTPVPAAGGQVVVDSDDPAVAAEGEQKEDTIMAVGLPSKWNGGESSRKSFHVVVQSNQHRLALLILKWTCVCFMSFTTIMYCTITLRTSSSSFDHPQVVSIGRQMMIHPGSLRFQHHHPLFHYTMGGNNIGGEETNYDAKHNRRSAQPAGSQQSTTTTNPPRIVALRYGGSRDTTSITMEGLEQIHFPIIKKAGPHTLLEYTNPQNLNMTSINIYEEDHDSDSEEDDNSSDSDDEKHKKKDSEDEIDRPYEQRSVCIPQHDWQTMSFPTCNSIHEQPMMQQLIQRLRIPNPKKFYLGEGVTRVVWLLERLDFPTSEYYGDELLALKTHHINRQWSPDNFDRNRIDALVSERLTKSPHILDVYGFCGNSALYEVADGGTLEDAISTNREYGSESASEDDLKDYDEDAEPVNDAPWDTWNSTRKMEVALQIVGAVADLHSIDSNQYASVAHCDLDLTQFVSTDYGKTFKLNDFNGGRLIYWDTEYDKICTFKSGMVGGRFRAPEEVKEEYDYPATAAIDVYALGTALYEILTGKEPFETRSRKTVRRLFAEGQRPHLSKKYIDDDSDQYEKALVEAMQNCWTNDFLERPTARTIEEILLSHKKSTT